MLSHSISSFSCAYFQKRLCLRDYAADPSESRLLQRGVHPSSSESVSVVGDWAYQIHWHYHSRWSWSCSKLHAPCHVHEVLCPWSRDITRAMSFEAVLDAAVQRLGRVKTSLLSNQDLPESKMPKCGFRCNGARSRSEESMSDNDVEERLYVIALAGFPSNSSKAESMTGLMLCC